MYRESGRPDEAGAAALGRHQCVRAGRWADLVDLVDLPPAVFLRRSADCIMEAERGSPCSQDLIEQTPQGKALL